MISKRRQVRVLICCKIPFRAMNPVLILSLPWLTDFASQKLEETPSPERTTKISQLVDDLVDVVFLSVETGMETKR